MRAQPTAWSQSSVPRNFRAPCGPEAKHGGWERLVMEAWNFPRSSRGTRPQLGTKGQGDVMEMASEQGLRGSAIYALGKLGKTRFQP